MGEEEKRKYRQNGAFVFEKWQFYLLLIGIIFSVGGFFTLTQTTLADHTKKIETIEVWEKAHEIGQDNVDRYNVRKTDEISFNVKAICEKLGVKYTSSEITNK